MRFRRQNKYKIPHFLLFLELTWNPGPPAGPFVYTFGVSWCRKSSNSLPAFTVLSFGYGRAPGEVCKHAWYWQPTLCNPQGLQLRKAARARIGPAVLSDSGFWRKRSRSCGSRSRSQHEFTEGRSKPVGVPLLNVGAYSNDVIHWREVQVGGSHMV